MTPFDLERNPQQERMGPLLTELGYCGNECSNTKYYLDFGRLPHGIRLRGNSPDWKSGFLDVSLQRGVGAVSTCFLLLHLGFYLPKSNYRSGMSLRCQNVILHFVQDISVSPQETEALSEAKGLDDFVPSLRSRAGLPYRQCSHGGMTLWVNHTQ